MSEDLGPVISSPGSAVEGPPDAVEASSVRRSAAGSSTGSSLPRPPAHAAGLVDIPVAVGWKRVGRVVLVLVLVAAVARLAALGARPLHHDESLDAWFSWKFLNGTYGGYDPVYHGPLRFYITAALFALVGESVTVARLTAALAGVVVVALPWLWRYRLGRVGTVATVGLLAVSPAMLYFSRMGREDSLFLALSLGAVMVLLALIERPRVWHPTALLMLLVSAMAVKESVFLLVFVFGAFGMILVIQDLLLAPASAAPREGEATDEGRDEPVPSERGRVFAEFGEPGLLRATTVAGLVLLVATFFWIGVDPGEEMSVAGAEVDPTFFKLGLYGGLLALGIVASAAAAWRRGVGIDDVRVIRSIRTVGVPAWVVAISATVIWFVLLFSQFLTDFSGPGAPTAPHGALRNGLTAGIEYWLGEQDTVRGDNRWQYYLAVIPAYEWFIVALAVLGVVRVLRRPDLFGQMLVWWAVASFVVHSWAGERMPWLMIHPLLPIVVLAGLGVQELFDRVWSRRRAILGPVLGVVFVAGLVWTGHTAYQAAYVRGGEPQELFVQAAQATPEVPEWSDRLLRLERLVQAEFGRDLNVSIDADVYWPYGWYLRDFPTSTYSLIEQWTTPPSSDVIFVPHWDRQQLMETLDGYVEIPYEHRWWWVPDLDGGAGGFDPSTTASAWLNWLWDREPWSGTESDPSDCPGSLSGSVFMRETVYELEQSYTAANPDEPAAKPGYDGSCEREDAEASPGSL